MSDSDIISFGTENFVLKKELKKQYSRVQGYLISKLRKLIDKVDIDEEIHVELKRMGTLAIGLEIIFDSATDDNHKTIEICSSRQASELIGILVQHMSFLSEKIVHVATEEALKVHFEETYTHLLAIVNQAKTIENSVIFTSASAKLKDFEKEKEKASSQ